MLLQEKFDNIINCIERLVDAGENDILRALVKETGYNERLLGDSFLFVTDMTLPRYIYQRRLVHALKTRMECDLSVEDVYGIAGYSDAAAFSKACKIRLGFSPSQITEDNLQEYTPLYFSKIVSGENAERLENDTLKYKNNTICGVSAEQFAEIKQILGLGAIYGLSDEEAEFVYQLSQNCQITTAQAANFYDEFLLQIENGSAIIGYDLFEMAEVACQYDLSYSETQAVFFEISRHGYKSVHTLPDGFFKIYFSTLNEQFCGLSVPHICEILETLKDHDMSLDDIDDVLNYATTYNVDPVEIIENYQQYADAYDEMLSGTCDGQPADDDTDGFGYRSIWELPEN